MSITKNMLFVDRYAYLYRKHADQVTKQTDRFIKSREYIYNYIFEHHPDAYKNLLKENFTIPACNSEKKSSLLIIGILLTKNTPGTQGFGELLERAKKLDPSDYGVHLKTFHQHMSLNRHRAARGSANTILSLPGTHSQIIGHSLLMKLYQVMENKEAYTIHKEKYTKALQAYDIDKVLLEAY
jgi:hypothetical protein